MLCLEGTMIFLNLISFSHELSPDIKISFDDKAESDPENYWLKPTWLCLTLWAFDMSSDV